MNFLINMDAWAFLFPIFGVTSAEEMKNFLKSWGVDSIPSALCARNSKSFPLRQSLFFWNFQPPHMELLCCSETQKSRLTKEWLFGLMLTKTIKMHENHEKKVISGSAGFFCCNCKSTFAATLHTLRITMLNKVIHFLLFLPISWQVFFHREQRTVYWSLHHNSFPTWTSHHLLQFLCSEYFPFLV